MQGELRRFLAKVDFAGGADAFNVATVGREIEIRLEQLRFAVMPLELKGAQHLGELSAQRARLQMRTQPRQLHRDRGRAAAAPFPAAEIPRGAHDSDRIDARMFAEEAVLVQERRLHELRRNAIERRENAIFFVAAQRHPELVAVAIKNAPRKADVVHERRFREAEPELPAESVATTRPAAAILGSARDSRAGFGDPPKRTFFGRRNRLKSKFALASRQHQHASRVRSPEYAASFFISRRPP